MKQLTPLQIKRQDFIDNLIFDTIRKIHPACRTIEWDIEMIANIRDSIRYWVVDYHKLCTEQEYYAFLAGESNPPLTIT